MNFRFNPLKTNCLQLNTIKANQSLLKSKGNREKMRIPILPLRERRIEQNIKMMIQSQIFL